MGRICVRFLYTYEYSRESFTANGFNKLLRCAAAVEALKQKSISI